MKKKSNERNNFRTHENKTCLTKNENKSHDPKNQPRETKAISQQLDRQPL